MFPTWGGSVSRTGETGQAFAPGVTDRPFAWWPLVVPAVYFFAVADNLSGWSAFFLVMAGYGAEYFVDKKLNRTTTTAAVAAVAPAEWLDKVVGLIEPEVWLVLGLGLAPLAVLAGSVGFYFWLRRPADLANHPFVRFPWLVGGVAAVFAAYRGDFPVGWVLAAWGSVFLFCHFFHFCRRAYEFDPPALSPGYEVSGLPAAVVSAAVFTIDFFHWLGWYGFAVFPLGLFRLTQMVYGLYFLWCYLVDHQKRTPALVYVTFPIYYAVGPWAAAWKEIGVAGKAATIGTVGAAAIAAGTTYSNHFLERTRRVHEVKLTEYKVSQHNEMMRQKLIYQAREYANKREHEYLKKGMNYERVGDDFYNVSPAGLFSSPKQTSRPAKVLPPDDSDITLYSPCEPWVELTPYYLVVLLGGLAVLAVGVWWLYRRSSSK